MTMSELLNLRLGERGMTAQELAERIDRSPNSLGTWLKRNRFPKDDWLKMAEILDLPIDEETLRNEYGLVSFARPRLAHRDIDRCTTLGEVFAWSQRQTGKLKSMYPKVDIAARKLLSTMAVDDLFVFTSLNVTPLEQQDHLVRDAAVQALQKGGTLFYIRPSNKAIARLGRQFGMGQLWKEDEMDAAFEFLKERASRTNRQRRPAQLVQMYYDHLCPFWTPGFAYALYQSKQGERQMTARHTSGYYPKSPQSGFVIPCDLEFINRFVEFVLRVTSDLTAINAMTGRGGNTARDIIGSARTLLSQSGR